MKIGIDIDDTIADTYEIAFAYAQNYTINELGRTGQVQDITAKHHFYLKAMHDWNHEEEMDFWHKYYAEMIDKIRPFTMAVETINKLKEEGNEIVIVTARWPEETCDVFKITEQWLENNNIKYDDIVFDAQNKAQVALDKKLDIFIDDSFKNCTEVANAGVKSYIIETRTNKGLCADNVTRVYSWPDIYNKISFEK